MIRGDEEDCWVQCERCKKLVLVQDTTAKEIPLSTEDKEMMAPMYEYTCTTCKENNNV